MNTNLYQQFRDHHSFSSVETLIDTLDGRLPADAPETYAEFASESVNSILQDLSWDDLERTGPRTMREHEILGYEYERPGLRVYLHATFTSETRDLKNTTVRITVGHEIDELLPDTDEQTTLRYVVRPDGHITQDPSKQ